VPGDEQVRVVDLRAGQTPAVVVLQLGFDVADLVRVAAARRAGAAVAPFRAEAVATHQSRALNQNCASSGLTENAGHELAEHEIGGPSNRA